MAELNVHEVKTQLSKLLARVEAGEEIIIARNGRPVARLVKVEGPARRLFGSDRGLFNVPDAFDTFCAFWFGLPPAGADASSSRVRALRDLRIDAAPGRPQP